MALVNKIKSFYPQLTETDFDPINGTIALRNDSDGNGDYIAKWEHPDFIKPTQEQLDAVS